MLTIKIHRPKEFLNNSRDYKLFIDNQCVGLISSGEIKAFTVSNENHQICAKIDWCSSETLLLEVENEETICLQVNGSKFMRLLACLVVGIIVLHLIMSLLVITQFSIFLIFPIAFVYIFQVVSHEVCKAESYSENSRPQ